MNRTLVFPACIKEYGRIFKVYIPDLDMECRAPDFASAFSKTRRLIRLAFITNELNLADLQGELCSKNRVEGLLSQNHRGDYLGEKIIYVDLSVNTPGGFATGELAITLSQSMIEAIQEEDIDFNRIAEEALHDSLLKKTLLRDANDLLEQTVCVVTTQGQLFGVLKGIKNPDSLSFTINLQTGVHTVRQIHASHIMEIRGVPVAMNEIGTFHLENQAGLVSIAGHLWWYRDHIDAYLEYDPLFDIEEQKAFEYLSDFNKVKYDLDDEIRHDIAAFLMDSSAIPLLFPDAGEDPEEYKQVVFERLAEKLELWFVDISLIGKIYMDYNFSNEVGSLSVSVDTDLNNMAPRFKLSAVNTFDDDEDDEADINLEEEYL